MVERIKDRVLFMGQEVAGREHLRTQQYVCPLVGEAEAAENRWT